MKDNKGITLVALVITIIVLMILAVIVMLPITACSNKSSPIFNGNVEIDATSFEGKTFPFVYVNTDGNSQITKEEYTNCSVSVNNTENEYVIDNATAKIKGRGNSTWGMPKKPYKIKFDSKVNLFGNGKEKTWLLIANYCDKSLSRNLLAYEIAREVGLSETSTTQPVNVFLNGVYQGVYLVCEQVEIGKTRLNIESDLDNIDTGYLLEMDAHVVDEGVEDIDYFSIDGKMYALKDPEREEAFTDEHFNFIKNYVANCYNALSSNDYAVVQNYIDVLSFAKCYLVHEMFNNIDVGFSSFYIYKKAGDKLFAGPLWDFDISSGNCDYTTRLNDGNNPEYLYAKNNNVWYNKLLNFAEFRTLVAEQLALYKDVILAKKQEVVEYQLEYKDNNALNFEVWDILHRYVWPNPKKVVKLHTFERQLAYLDSWLTVKLNYMSTVYTIA